MARRLSRGDIWLLDRPRPDKRRPVVILARPSLIQALHTVTVAAVTSTLRGAPTEVEVRSFETEDYVHVVALPSGADWGAVDFAVERLESNTTDPSAAVRALAVREISRSLGIDPRRLAVGRLGTTHSGHSGWRGGPPRVELGTPRSSRIPTIELDGGPTSLSLSLSHHGRFISFAMTPRAEPSIHANRRPEHPEMLAASGATRR